MRTNISVLTQPDFKKIVIFYVIFQNSYLCWSGTFHTVFLERKSLAQVDSEKNNILQKEQRISTYKQNK